MTSLIQSFDAEGVNFVSTELTNPKGDVIDDYVAIIPFDENFYEALDKDNSKYVVKHGGYWIDKLVLDKNVLKDIPLNRRLIWSLSEEPGETLFHSSIVKAIIALEPTDVFFQNIEENDFKSLDWR